MNHSVSEGVSSTPQVVDSVDGSNCQSDIRMSGMMNSGPSKLPRKIRRAHYMAEQQAAQGQFAQALADALRAAPRATAPSRQL